MPFCGLAVSATRRLNILQLFLKIPGNRGPARASLSPKCEIIPAYRAELPRAEAILPYLRRLDQTRQYANRGELIERLERRLAERLGLAQGQLVLAASGTAALTGAILAAAGRAGAERPYCLCTGYTFPAAALAAELCGYRLYLLDIDAGDWSLSPERVLGHPLLSRAGLIIVAAPFGRIPLSAWDEVSRRTGVPVVIDGAACLEAYVDAPAAALGRTPVALSFHATKAFGCGEGGAVVSADQDLLPQVYSALNFGFAGERETAGPGFNGKMSEYHAAVGLAELDGWDVKRAALARVAASYAQAAADRGQRLYAAPMIASNYVLLETAEVEQSHGIGAALRRHGIESRLWYGLGLHRQPHFASAERDPLPIVEDVAPRLIGLPVASDLREEEIEYILDIAATA